MTNGRADVVRLLLERGARVTNSGELFENAIREGHEEIFDLWLASTGAAGVPRDSLITATREGQTSIVRKLIEAGVEDDNGLAPLLWSICTDRQAIFDMLLDADAKIYIQDNAGKTPLLWAVQKGHHAMFHSLMGKGANVNPGGSALISAIYNADTEMAIALINRGANVNPVTEDGWPPLMYAAMRGMQEVFERLMTARVDVNRKNRSGATALMQAAISGEAGMVASLLAAGADVNAADSTGMTALMWAIQRGNEAVSRSC